MPSPAMVFAFILATIFGAIFHLIIGGDIRRLALYLMASWLGFALGHIIGVLAGLDLLRVGTLRLFSASLGSVIALVFVRLILFRARPQQGR